ncbi:hypothetical protein FH969_07825 [Miniimonas arenae]|uniref:Uncharacterized protein n=1 Tax=Miniimonas arenae TaxID=676201 RepID=A0A5C5BBV5_9MICO|nr:hypothetical protein [Miniimonas arenae]TNU74723.1 hypothetical protein FH969_07825 [Miniimonas arenae]
MRVRPSRCAALTAGALVAGLVSSCGTSSTSASRHELFASLNEISQASDLVIVGRTDPQDVDSPARDWPDLTVSTAEVLEVLAHGSTDDANVTTSGSLVRVWQTGRNDNADAPMLTLEPGGVYLLYLTHMGLEGADDSDYYITGATAGVYVLSGGMELSETAVFVRADPTSDDTLPREVTLGEARD